MSGQGAGLPTNALPVVVIGAGPVGLAAAANLEAHRVPFVLLEAGPSVGHSVRQWGHIRVFSPWKNNIDLVARDFLVEQGWEPPDGEGLPLGRELVELYLEPLGTHPRLKPSIRTGAKVVRIEAERHTPAAAEPSTFFVTLASGETLSARAIIDASGTWTNPRRLGPAGMPMAEEALLHDHIRYGIPDILGADRKRYFGKRVLVVGSGHSAMNVVKALVTLNTETPGGEIIWSMRRDALERLLNRGPDRLPARAELENEGQNLLASGAVTPLLDLEIRALRRSSSELAVEGKKDGKAFVQRADEIIVAAGLRPELAMFRSLELDIDPDLQCVAGLAPLLRSLPGFRGEIPKHGWRELSHPQPNLFIIGIKSFGQAPSFDLVTGYMQMKSVVAELAAQGREKPEDDSCTVIPPCPDIAPRTLSHSEPQAGDR